MRGGVIAVTLLLALSAGNASAKTVCQTDTSLRAAGALNAAGSTAAAKKLYEAALKAHPNTKCASAALAQINATPAKSRTDRLTAWLTAKTKLLAALVVPLIAVLIALSLAFVALTYSGRFRRYFRRVWGFRSALRSMLSVQGFTDSDGTTAAAGVTAMTRAGVQRLSRAQDRRGNYRLDTITGAEGVDTRIGKLGDAIPQVKSVVAVLGFAKAAARLPRYALQGTLLVPATGRHAITLQLEDSTGVAAASTLRAVDARYLSPLEHLANAASAWADFRIRELEGLERPRITASAESYGYFRSGVAFADSGRDAEAVNAYLDALHIDPRNVGALHNLARIRSDRPVAIELLTTAWMISKSSLDPARDAEWHTVLYSLSAELANTGHREVALQHTLELVRRAGSVVVLPSDGSDRLVRFLEDAVVPTAIVLLAGLVLDGSVDVMELSELVDLTIAHDADPRKPLPSAASLIALVLRPQCVNYRTRYNLACYFTERSDYARAMTELEAALAAAPPEQRPKVAHQAAGDETLKPLLEHDQATRQLLAEYAPAVSLPDYRRVPRHATLARSGS